MKVLSIIDSFKGTITSNELGMIMTDVLTTKKIIAEYIPISDGGDGFLDAIEKALKTKRVFVEVFDPLDRKIQTYYLLEEINNIAYIELAKCSGINLLSSDELNPFNTSTYGLGEIINHAIDLGIKKIIVGIGGSATNDGGAGMLNAMGCLFFDEDNILIKKINGGNIDSVTSIDPSSLFDKIKDMEFTVISDVTNPLLFDKGSSFTFAKQKGAKEHELIVLDKKMEIYTQVIETYLQKSFKDAPGAGAAGGVGFAYYSLLKANFCSGIDYILDLIDFDNLIQDYDYIITGEGKIDYQSLNGKVIFGISQRAKDKKVILVCAINEIDPKILNDRNIFKLYSVVDQFASIQESLRDPKYYYKKMCESIEF